MTPPSPTTLDVLVGQLLHLGIRSGGVLVVHTSLSTIGPVEDGPLGLINALLDALGPDGTLVMPTMTDGKTLFDPRTTPTLDMGVVAETFWRLPGVLRSDHPGASFAAIGPQAETICAPQPLEPPHGPHSPIGRVHALGGQVLLLGVSHDADTMLHLAENLAHVPYRVVHPCMVEIAGRAELVGIAETDHCGQGFRKLDGWLRATDQQREGPVGHGYARLVEAEVLVNTAVAHLILDPLVFLCPPMSGCFECDRAHASVWHFEQALSD